ncbi:GNAT family N-acetyltransferase [Brevibacillus formosus]|uniref:N-acetyltransferase domain-containing protein n=1 Tax=Brevibacillus formosus TaxID=54913 RepID=A0ABQ0TDS3_9BACL|nr:GNAT family N-acetyltransferase [Brevibacillus formosus]MED1955135.1 GNAT family N-acetyltransferase [Brevibacillus formosus]PSJ94995.1 N-acetyltransferase [Brevibacillus formosus]GED61426.1 hypothetical protein BFO01nite_55580 [Brevibacillus formosus]
MKNKNSIDKTLASLFNFDPFSILNRKYEPLPLQKRDNVEYEVQWQKTELEKDGHKVIHIAQNKICERIMIYRMFFGDGWDEVDINLGMKVISNDGVMVPDPNTYLVFDTEQKHLRIADIRIEGDQVNKGYGTILMNAIMQLGNELNVQCITGWISQVDWDHIERLTHFYKKFGFSCEINHEIKHGTIIWKNADYIREDKI